MQKKTALLKIALAFVLASLLTTAYIFSPKLFLSLDNRLRDFMFIVRGELPKSNDIIIVDIDEKSLKAYGQWPWSRDKVSELLYKLTNLQAGIIGLDIIFAEPDRSSPHRLSEKFKEITQSLPNYDNILARTFQNTPVVGGYIFLFGKQVQKEAPIIPAIVIQKGMKNNKTLLAPNSVILNIPILQDAMYSSGFFNNVSDSDGIIRNVPLVMSYDYSIYTSLALEMVRIYSGENKMEIHGDELGLNQILFGKYHIPVDNSGRLQVNFRGRNHHFPYISVLDLLTDKISIDKIRGKFILVGTSAVGLYDLRSSPLDSNIPGVEIHANVIDNLLRGDFLSKPIDYPAKNIMIFWGIIFFTMFILSYIRSWLVLPAGIVLFSGLTYLFYYLLIEKLLIFNLLFPALAFWSTLLLIIATDYVLEHRQKKEAKKILGKKVSPRVMDYLLEHADEDLVASREVETTIFFSDVVGFTSISEKIGSPDKLISMLNTYMTPMVETIVQNQGTIDKFIGDAIMAYWNAPVEVTNHADKAVQSAIKQIESLAKINAIVTPKYSVTLDIGIGLHTGLVTAGDMGAEGRSDYTIIGDNVNLASRLEGLTRFYDVQILISEATHEALKGENYHIRPLDYVAVKGKTQPVAIFEVICNTKTYTNKELTLYVETLSLFRKGNVMEALKQFQVLEEMHPSRLYVLYIERCQKFISNPDLEFTSILKMETK